jgi:hypothetical protein
VILAAAAAAAVAVLADDTGGESKKAGPIALLVILLLAVACYFLFRSMTRHLRRVRENFPDDVPPADADAPAPMLHDDDRPIAPTRRESGPGEHEPPPPS